MNPRFSLWPRSCTDLCSLLSPLCPQPRAAIALNSPAELRLQPWTNQKRPRALKVRPPGVQPMPTEVSSDELLLPLE